MRVFFSEVITNLADAYQQRTKLLWDSNVLWYRHCSSLVGTECVGLSGVSILLGLTTCTL